MDRRHCRGCAGGGSLVSDYIDGTGDLKRMIGNTVLLYLMAEGGMDGNTYRRLATSARAIGDRDEPKARSSGADSCGQRYLFEDERPGLFWGGSHEHQG